MSVSGAVPASTGFSLSSLSLPAPLWGPCAGLLCQSRGLWGPARGTCVGAGARVQGPRLEKPGPLLAALTGPACPETRRPSRCAQGRWAPSWSVPRPWQLLFPAGVPWGPSPLRAAVGGTSLTGPLVPSPSWPWGCGGSAWSPPATCAWTGRAVPGPGAWLPAMWTPSLAGQAGSGPKRPVPQRPKARLPGQSRCWAAPAPAFRGPAAPAACGQRPDQEPEAGPQGPPGAASGHAGHRLRWGGP